MNRSDGEIKFAKAEVKRKEYLTSRETITAHIKEIGRRIIADAENLAFEPSKCSAISITAEISPGNKVTEIQYTYKATMIADPRAGGETE